MSVKESMADAELLIEGKVAGVSVDDAVRGVRSALFDYTGAAASCLRCGQYAEADQWAVRAAECAKALKVLGMVAKHFDAVRTLIAQRERDALDAADTVARADAAAQARRKHFAEKRARERMRSL